MQIITNSLRVFLLSLFLSWAFIAQAQLEIPSLTSPVMDEVGLLNAGTKSQIENSLFQFKNQTGVQLQVYVIKSLGGDSIESVAIQVFDRWKIGDEKTDRGLLFLIAPNEKRMRIEVGQGLEGDIPDVIAKRIISDIVRPHFQRNQFDIGVLQGVQSIQYYIAGATPAEKAKLQQTQQSSKKGNSWIFFIVAGIWLLIFMVNPSLALHILFAAMSNAGRGGGSSRGSWSGGGGRSSGGGASGGW